MEETKETTTSATEAEIIEKQREMIRRLTAVVCAPELKMMDAQREMIRRLVAVVEAGEHRWMEGHIGCASCPLIFEARELLKR